MILPPCHSRRVFDANSKEYFCAHPRHHSKDNVVTLEICNCCPLWREPAPEVFRPLPKEFPPKPRGLCQFVGAETGLRECPSCRGSVRVKVFACHHPRHQETTVAECAECLDFEPRGDQSKAKEKSMIGGDPA